MLFNNKAILKLKDNACSNFFFSSHECQYKSKSRKVRINHRIHIKNRYILNKIVTSVQLHAVLASFSFQYFAVSSSLKSAFGIRANFRLAVPCCWLDLRERQVIQMWTVVVSFFLKLKILAKPVGIFVKILSSNFRPGVCKLWKLLRNPRKDENIIKKSKFNLQFIYLYLGDPLAHRLPRYLIAHWFMLLGITRLVIRPYIILACQWTLLASSRCDRQRLNSYGNTRIG